MDQKPEDNKTNPPPPATKSDETKKGYNEKNPTQPQGAFKPDKTTSPEKAPDTE